MQPDHVTGLSIAAAIADDSGTSEPKAIGGWGGTEEFACLVSARACLGSIRSSLSSFGDAELAAALSRIWTAYQQFPELALECPIEDFLEEVRLTAADPRAQTLAAVIGYLSAPEPNQSMTAQLLALTEAKDGWETFLSHLRLILGCREIAWSLVEKLLEPLQREGRSDRVLQLLSAVSGHIEFADERGRLGFEDLLCSLLGLAQSPHEPGSLVRLAVAARHRLRWGVSDAPANRAAGMLVDTADRLRRLLSPAPPDARPVVAWSSGRLSFQEFLLQWPCTLELPIDLEDREFIKEAYRAIVLRDPTLEEIQQHLAVMREGASKRWIVEDLLAGEELRSLDRQLRVSLGDCVITEPGRLPNENNPVVTWPIRTVSYPPTT